MSVWPRAAGMLRLAALCVCTALPAPAALAQYTGPALEACRTYAEREHAKDSVVPTAVVFDQDRFLNIDRYTRKAAGQFVSSILYGNGAIVPSKGLAVEMSFVCLLASDQRAVFFYWSPRLDAPVLVQCTRGAAQKNDAGACLESLLQVTEQDLTQAYAARYQDARDIDAKSGNQDASNAFRKSNDAWRAYRDAECARRGARDTQHGIRDVHKACVVELSRRRLLDVR